MTFPLMSPSRGSLPKLQWLELNQPDLNGRSRFTRKATQQSAMKSHTQCTGQIYMTFPLMSPSRGSL
nr:hypothetical protein CFP56_50217 [Quercus suber]